MGLAEIDLLAPDFRDQRWDHYRDARAHGEFARWDYGFMALTYEAVEQVAPCTGPGAATVRPGGGQWACDPAQVGPRTRYPWT